MKITLDTVVTQKPDLLSSNLDGETILLEIEKEVYYGMNRVSTRIWELLGEPRKLSAICEELLKDYAVEREQCEQEVLTFVQKLASEGLISECTETPAP